MFLAFVAVFISMLFILFVTVHHQTNFLVNLYWDNKDSESHYDKLYTDTHRHTDTHTHTHTHMHTHTHTHVSSYHRLIYSPK